MNHHAGDESRDQLRKTVEAFLEAVPPFWHRIRATIRENASQKFDLTVEQFHILRRLEHCEGSVSELAGFKCISKAAVSQAVLPLVKRGLIMRRVDDADRRHVRLDLTCEGRKLLEEILEDTKRWMMEALRSMTDSELQTLMSAMESLGGINRR